MDLEYAVQILQIRHGATDRRLRTPRIHEAIGELASIGLLGGGRGARAPADYDFLRMLINGLRMLRGSALDLFLPEDGSEEYSHLARRIGYVAEGDLSPARRLSLEFEARTADVRAFADRHFSGEDHYTVRPTNAADLVLSGASNDAERDSILSSKGFKNPARAFVNLRNIAGTGADSRESPEPRRRGAWASRGSRSWPAISCRRGRTPTWPSTTGNASSIPFPIPPRTSR